MTFLVVPHAATDRQARSVNRNRGLRDGIVSSVSERGLRRATGRRYRKGGMDVWGEEAVWQCRGTEGEGRGLTGWLSAPREIVDVLSDFFDLLGVLDESGRKNEICIG